MLRRWIKSSLQVIPLRSGKCRIRKQYNIPIRGIDVTDEIEDLLLGQDTEMATVELPPRRMDMLMHHRIDATEELRMVNI
jgi:hypothetical protein